MKLVIIGAPGAGKGTQAMKLCEYFNIPHLSTGDIFRYNIKKGTSLGLKVKEIINRGLLVPDEITLDIVRERLLQKDCSNGFLMDGFPRTVKQAEYFDLLMKDLQTSLDAAINLKVGDEVILKRMVGRRMCVSCGASFHVEKIPTKVEGICDYCGDLVIHREDDKIETVKQRLQVYHVQTEPIIEYYKIGGILKNVIGKDNVEDTTLELYKVLQIDT